MRGESCSVVNSRPTTAAMVKISLHRFESRSNRRPITSRTPSGMRNICEFYGADFALSYPNLVCSDCQPKAVNADENSPVHLSWDDDGDNPVFIDGIKCWRRYRFGRYITMRDVHNFSTLTEFYRYHWGL